MSTSSGIPPKRVEPRTKLRKGTHSCQECRLRKSRCVPRPENPLTCLECFSRGVRCHSQDGSLPQLDDRPTLRDRVARLEHSLQSFQERHISSKAVQNTEKDVAETLTNLRSQNIALTPASSDDVRPSSSHHDQSPLLSLFDNTIVKRDDAWSNDAGHPPLHNPSGNERSKFRRTSVRQALLSPLPSTRDLVMILEAAEGIWGAYKRMFPEVNAYNSHDTLKQFTFWCLSQENPSYVAMALLCVSTSLQYLYRRIPELSLTLPLPPRELMNHYFELVDRLIIADNEFAATPEGVDVIVFRAKCHFNLGQPRHCWLLFRQAISIAQLLGLTKNRKLRQDEGEASIQKRLKAWRLRFQYDRYTSLLLGLPYAVNGDDDQVETNVVERRSDSSNWSDLLYRKLYAISGRIIDRNQSSAKPSLALTLDIDQGLEDIISTIPRHWWNTQSAREAGSITTNDYFARLMAQFWYFQIKSFLHLPFMLESLLDQRVEHSREACFDATRRLLGLYHIMRSREDDLGFDMCKVIDFQGFTAAVVLLLGLLGYGRTSSVQDLELQESDWQMIETTRVILRRTSAEEGNSVAVQSLEVLDLLCTVRYENSSEGAFRGSRWEGRVAIPCFGAITISRGASFRTPILPTFPQPTIPSRVDDLMQEQAEQNDPETIEHNADSTIIPDILYPQIDIDWQSMINVDLDEDWGWKLGGMEI